jgi:hypothetical protein
LLAFIGIAELPYGYYEFLRWVLTAASVLIVVLCVRWKQYGWFVVALPIFILWFPPFHITMDKSAWVGLDLIAGVVLIVSGSVLAKPSDPQS